MSKPRVALVTNVLSHYRVPCFSELAACHDISVDFYVLGKNMPRRGYVLATDTPPFPVHALPGRSWPSPPFDDLHLNDPRPALRGHDLLILGGWAEPTYLLLWALALASRKRVAFWVESTLNEQPRGGWKEALKREMLGTSAGAIVPGRRSAEYCAWLGLPSERVFVAPNAVDVDYFRSRAEELFPRRSELRAELGLSGPVILFVGRMVEEWKSISTLIRAFHRLGDPGAELVLVGEGEDRPGYMRLATELGLERVCFVDFMSHDQLCRYYAAADIFVLPSRSEPWGFVVNEAMEFGLPIIASQAVGAAPDLIGEGENGFIVPPRDEERLAAALGCLVDDRDRRREMGAASKRRIADFTPKAWASGMGQAIQGAMTHG